MYMQRIHFRTLCFKAGMSGHMQAPTLSQMQPISPLQFRGYGPEGLPPQQHPSTSLPHTMHGGHTPLPMDVMAQSQQSKYYVEFLLISSYEGHTWGACSIPVIV